jgi:predicted glycosyltransferase
MSVRVLFDVGHPAHVHLFRNPIQELASRGHETVVTSRHKEVTTRLLDAYGIEHEPLSTHGETTPALLAEWALRGARLFRVARRFDPDVVVSHFNPAAIAVAGLVGARSVVCNDDEANLHPPGRLALAGASVVCTPATFTHDHGDSHRRYEGIHELAYLHRDKFERRPGVLESHGVDPSETYYVLRFVSWGAHHDVGESGLSREAKRDLVEFLDDRGEVYISSEGDLPAAFEGYELPVPPQHVHQLLAFADLYAGDSQTMALEAGVLGTPSVRSNTLAASVEMGTFEHLEKEYGLVRSIGDEVEAVATVKRLARDAEVSDRWLRRRERFLADSVDVTGFLVDVITRQAREGPARQTEDTAAVVGHR